VSGITAGGAGIEAAGGAGAIPGLRYRRGPGAKKPIYWTRPS